MGHDASISAPVGQSASADPQGASGEGVPGAISQGPTGQTPLTVSGDVGSPDSENATADGRELRSRRTKQTIVESWLDLVEGGNVSPTARQIADRAGIGLRTVFQHFDDMEDLHASAARLHFDRIGPFLALDASGDFAERVSQFATHRKRLFERITPVRRAALHRSVITSTIEELLNEGDNRFASLIFIAFDRELSGRSAAEQATLRLASAASLSWSAWDYLRQTAKQSSAEAEGVFAHTCKRLFGTE